MEAILHIMEAILHIIGGLFAFWIMLMIAGLIWKGFKIIRLSPYKKPFDNIASKIHPWSSRLGFEYGDRLEKKDIDFRYKHLKAIVELNEFSEFTTEDLLPYKMTEQVLNDAYKYTLEMSEEYETARTRYWGMKTALEDL